MPEELQGDDIDEAMDFSEEFLGRFEAQVKADRDALEQEKAKNKQLRAETDATIKNQADAIKEHIAELAGKDAELAGKNAELADKNAELADKNAELAKYRQKEEDENRKKKRRKICLQIAGAGLGIVAVVLFIVWLCYKFPSPIVSAIGIIVSLMSICFPAFRFIPRKCQELKGLEGPKGDG